MCKMIFVHNFDEEWKRKFPLGFCCGEFYDNRPLIFLGVIASFHWNVWLCDFWEYYDLLESLLLFLEMEWDKPFSCEKQLEITKQRKYIRKHWFWKDCTSGKDNKHMIPENQICSIIPQLVYWNGWGFHAVCCSSSCEEAGLRIWVWQTQKGWGYREENHKA